jgi:uncharacterized protein (DUF885 family)
MHFIRLILPLILIAPLAAQAAMAPDFSCERSGSPEGFADQAHRFILTQLALSPVQATQAGYHEHEGHSLDTELDDLSPLSLAHQRDVLVKGEHCFSAITNLQGEDAADLAMLLNSIRLSLLQLDELQPQIYRPDSYVELIGSGLFFPLTQTDGTQEQRLEHAVARMEQVPRLLQQARQQLREADPVFIATAREENDGNKEVIEQIGSMIAAGSPLHKRYDAAARQALASIKDYSTWLSKTLAKRPQTRSWRAGKELYSKLFPLAMGTGATLTPTQVLASAEADLDTLQTQMLALAEPLHAQWFAAHGSHEDLDPVQRRTKIISEVIDRIGDDHAKPETLISTVQSQLVEIGDFIRSHDQLTLSTRGNLKVIETPVFMRGTYSVAGFNAAPPLDPQAQAQYWVTPIDPKATTEQVESKLHEYNNWMLYYLSMHEALPGHYTQFEHANGIQPPSRRLLRTLLSNGPYVEGWGEYAVKEMVDAGFANRDPRFLLMVLKIRLRVAANAILDIRMHSLDMTDEQALDLMQRRAFQTKAEATGKLRRVKLGLTQLPTYYVGYRQWNEMRDRLQQQLGAGFSLKKFTDTALDEGAVPLPLLEPLLLERLRGDAPAY